MMGKVFFISDTHFSHEASIRFDSRPFENVEVMKQEMIDKWNQVVSKQDRVYILGDFTWERDEQAVLDLLNQLNGSKMLILGNHDQCARKTKIKQAFSQYVKEYDEIQVDGRKVILSHYPIASWKKMQGNIDNVDSAYIHLYGHVHGSDEFYYYEQYLKNLRANKKIVCEAYNVGAMMQWMNYQPKTLDEIKAGYQLMIDEYLKKYQDRKEESECMN